MKSEKLKNATQQHVLEALKETEQKLLEAAKYLAHPSYGHSSSTTFGIDELREEIFDYLEIPKK